MMYFSANRPKIFTASFGSTVVVVSVTVASALSWVKVRTCMLVCKFVLVGASAMKALVVEKRDIRTVEVFMML